MDDLFFAPPKLARIKRKTGESQRAQFVRLSLPQKRTYAPDNSWLKALAFILDFVLVSAVGSVIVWKFALPQSHPAAFSELIQWSESMIAWYADRENSPEAPIPNPSKSLKQALAVANEIQLLIFWIYFAIGEAFFAGSSLGKRICCICSVSTINLSSPPIMAGIVRGGLKTLPSTYSFH